MLRDPSLIPLSHHHQHGLALCVLIHRGLEEDRSPANVSRLASRVRDLVEIELGNHFDLEERLLFPAVRAELGPAPIVEELIADHRKIETLAACLAAGPAPETLLEFAALLSAHIRREERELFEDLQRRLPRQVLDAVGQAIARDAVRVCL